MLYPRSLRVLIAAGAKTALAATVWAGDPYQGLAEEVGAAAHDGGVLRVAVLPFSPAGGSDREGGLVLAERLVARLARGGAVEVVERTLLDKVLDEQKLGALGVVDQRQAGAMGRLLGVDAVVTGTFIPLAGSKVEVHARVIHARTARILGAASARVTKEWEEERMPVDALWDVRPPEVQRRSFPAPLVRLVPDPFRDAPNDNACSGWELEAERLQEETLELKARFWAARLRDPGFDMRAVTRNPGSEIRSLAMRQEFYAMIRAFHRGGSEPLERAERDTLEAADQRVADLVERCY